MTCVQNRTSRENAAVLAGFYASTLASVLASNATANYGLIVLADALSNSIQFAASVYLANMLVTGLLTLPAGILLDRYPRRTALLLSYAAFALVSGGVAFGLGIQFISTHRVWPLLVAAALNGVPLAIAQPGRFALLGALVAPGDAVRATAGLKLMMIVGFAAAPALVGTLRDGSSWTIVFSVIAGLFVIATLLLLLVPRSHDPAVHLGGAVRELALFLKHDWQLRHIIVFVFIALLTFGPVQVLVPKLLSEGLRMGERERGLLMGTLGGGLFMGGLFASGFNNLQLQGRAIALSTLIGVLGLVAVMPLSTSRSISLALFTIGCAGGVLTSLVPAVLQLATPDRLRGRIMSLYTIVFQTTPAIAATLAGSVAGKLGVAAALGLTGGAIGALALGAGMSLPGVRAFVRGERLSASEPLADAALATTKPTGSPAQWR